MIAGDSSTARPAPMGGYFLKRPDGRRSPRSRDIGPTKPACSLAIVTRLVDRNIVRRQRPARKHLQQPRKRCCDLDYKGKTRALLVSAQSNRSDSNGRNTMGGQKACARCCGFRARLCGFSWGGSATVGVEFKPGWQLAM